MQTARGIGDNGIWRSAKLNGILYLLDVGSKTTRSDRLKGPHICQNLNGPEPIIFPFHKPVELA